MFDDCWYPDWYPVKYNLILNNDVFKFLIIIILQFVKFNVATRKPTSGYQFGYQTWARAGDQICHPRIDRQGVSTGGNSILTLFMVLREERHPIVFCGVCVTATQSHNLSRHFRRWHGGEPRALCHGEEPTEPLYTNHQEYVSNHETTMPIKNPAVIRKTRQRRTLRTKVVQ